MYKNKTQVLLVDMQYGTSKNPDIDPRLGDQFLEEINASHRHSRGCFLIVRCQKLILIDRKVP